MRRLISVAIVSFVFTSWVGMPGVGFGAPAEELVPSEAIHSSVVLSSDVQGDGSILGVLKNNGTKRVRDVRLLVHHAWLWKDERTPGPPRSNPARSEFYIVEGEIPPGGELRFRYVPNPPLPAREDGHFATRAEIVGLTEG